MDLEKIERELSQIETRMTRRAADDKRDRERQCQLERERRAHQIRALVGVNRGVSYTVVNDRHVPWQTRGTVLSVARTRALVDYGTHGKWSCPIQSLAPAPAGDGWS